MTHRHRRRRLPLRLTFEGGDDPRRRAARGRHARACPGVRFDPRAGMHRAEAIRYRAIVQHLRDRKIPYRDEARGYEGKTPWPFRVAKQAFPHQTEGLEAWWKAGRRGRGRPADRDGQDPPGQPRHQRGRAAQPGRHPDDRPDEPVVRRADPGLRRRGRPARRRLLRHQAPDRHDLRLGLSERRAAGQQVRPDRLRRVPPPARPDRQRLGRWARSPRSGSA